MITKISNKLKLISSSSKLLVIGTLREEVDEILNKYFIQKEYINLNENSLKMFNNTYYEQFNIIIFSFNKNDFDLYRQNFTNFPNNSICIIDEPTYIDFKPYLNSSFSTLINPFVEDILLEKVFALLSVFEMENILKTKEKVVSRFKNDNTNNEIDEFLDKYSGEIMFINDDLNDSLERLKDLEITKEIFSKVSATLINLSNIMMKNKNLLHLSTLFSEFSQFLDSLVLEEIEPSRYCTFDYLTKIIEDLTIYIDELFVYRLFKDVKVFEDSMSNNIDYLEAQLLGLSEFDESDNLEFF